MRFDALFIYKLYVKSISIDKIIQSLKSGTLGHNSKYV